MGAFPAIIEEHYETQITATYTEKYKDAPRYVFKYLADGMWEIITVKEAAIELIQSQPFYATQTPQP